MALSWSKASATMFTSYMAISNMSVVIGGKLIEPLTQIMNSVPIYILMMLCMTSSFVFLKSMIVPKSIANIKSNRC